MSAGDTTMVLVGGAGSAIGGGGTFGLLGAYAAHGNPIALNGSVRTVDPAASRPVAAGFSEPFDSTTFAGFYVRRAGPPVDVQTFNGCPIGTGVCPIPGTPTTPATPEAPVLSGFVLEVDPLLQRPPDGPSLQVGGSDVLVIDFGTARGDPTPLGLSGAILVNQGNEYFFNVDEERRKQRAGRGGRP